MTDSLPNTVGDRQLGGDASVNGFSPRNLRERHTMNDQQQMTIDLGQVGHGVSSHQLDGRPKCTDNLAEQSGDDQLGRHGW